MKMREIKREKGWLMYPAPSHTYPERQCVYFYRRTMKIPQCARFLALCKLTARTSSYHHQFLDKVLT